MSQKITTQKCQDFHYIPSLTVITFSDDIQYSGLCNFCKLFFVQYAYSGLDIKNLSNYFGRKVEYTLTSSSENYFVLHYVVSGGIAGNLPEKNISYDSRTNELSGNCPMNSFKKQLSDSDAKNLELMIDQNIELFATK